MKKLFTLISFIALCNMLVFAQSPNWLWAKSAGGTLDDSSVSNCIDANGNIYVTGNFYSASITFGSTILTNAGGSDIFIVKYNSSGTVLWAKRFGGTGTDNCNKICVDQNGYIYIIGGFRSPSITFGSYTLNNVHCTGVLSDIFVVKLDSLGNVVWAKTHGGSDDDITNGLDVDVNGNVFVTGYFTSETIYFGTFLLNNPNYWGEYSAIYFTVKYNASGNVTWAKSVNFTSIPQNINVNGNSICTDANGNSYVTGSLNVYTAIFSNDTLTGYGNFFILKYNSAGNVIWTKRFGNAGFDVGKAICVDNNNNIYVIGTFRSSTFNLGSTVLTNSNNTNNIDDVFIAKFDSSGNALWAKKAGGSNYDIGGDIIVDINENVYVTGSFSSPSFSIGNIVLANADLTSTYKDIFVAKYDVAGNFLWGKSVGSTKEDIGAGICVDANESAYLTGSFSSGSLIFNSTTLTNATNPNTTPPTYPRLDFWIAKLNNISVNVAELQNESKEFIIYPNPVKSEFSIEVNSDVKQEIEILNIVGQSIYSSIINKKATLDVSSLPSGVYLIKLYTGESTIFKKMIKQ